MMQLWTTVGHPCVMSQSQDTSSSLQELTSLPPDSPVPLPPCTNIETPNVLIDNFVASLSFPDEAEERTGGGGAAANGDAGSAGEPLACVPVAPELESACAAVVAQQDDAADAVDAEPDDSSSPAHASELATASSSRDTAHHEHHTADEQDAADYEHQRAQLLQQVQDQSFAIETQIEEERQRQHAILLLALEQRKLSSLLRSAVEASSAGDKQAADSQAPPLPAEVETNGGDASAVSTATCEEDGCNDATAAAPPGVAARTTTTLRRSRSSSPEPSRRLQKLRPDTRVDIPSPHSRIDSDGEVARDKILSGHWLLRQQNVDSRLHAQLVEMGFESRVAVVALERTGSVSLQEAIEFCLEHNNEDNPSAFRTEGGDSDSSPDISIDGDGDDHLEAPSFGSFPMGGRAAVGHDVEHESQLLRLFVELLRRGEGPHTVSGRGLFAAGGASAPVRPSSASRHSLASGALSRRISMLEQLQQIAAQGQLDRIAPLVRAHSGPAQLSPFVDRQGSALGMMMRQVHQQQQRTSDPSNGGAADVAGVMQDDMMECSYCYDHVPKQDIKSMPCCCFTCCKSCMQQDFSVRINDGNTLIRCHHCGNPVSDNFIRESVTAETFSKFLRFKAARENPLLRTCSKCCHVQEGKSSKPSMTCAGCNHVYCFTHGDSHPGQSCADWARSHAAVEKATASAIKKDSKKCPQCRVVTYKTEGCNHMHCSRCGCDWCWICASKFDAQGRAYPLHYKWWNFFGCGGMQFNTCWGNSLSALYLKRFLTFLFVVTGVPLALGLGAAVLALYLALLFPVMIPAYIWGRKHYASWAYSFSDFFMHSLKKMVQVFGVLILAPPALALAVALFPLTIWVLRRMWADDD